MPLYEYHCDLCGEDFEAFRTPAARRRAACPNCGRQARKLVRAVGIIFKGSGFYVTDHRKPEPKDDGGAKKPASEPVASEKKSEG